MQSVSRDFAKGFAGLSGLGAILHELQGQKFAVVAGAAAGTKMNVAAMRTEDTVLAAFVQDGTSGVISADDAANITIQSTNAFGTITCAAVEANDTVTVDGKVFTYKVTPAADAEIAIGANNNASAENLMKAVNAWQNRYGGTTDRKAKVVATRADNVVTVSVNPANTLYLGAAGNAITLLSSNGTRLAVTGSGTITGGTDTGGIKSVTDLTGKVLILLWLDKVH